VRRLAFGLFTLFVLALASCGGSSSETPPPLEPLPANVRYNRSATTLPGDLGVSPKPAGSAAEVASAEPSAKAPPAKAPVPKSNF
jgi:hypothetical protein